MNKKTKKNVTIGVIVGIIVLVLFLFGTGTIKFPLASGVSGSQTLSISQANLKSSYAPLNGQAWLLTFSAGGLGQSYYGSFSPSDVADATSDGSKTTKSFTIETDYGATTCNYPIHPLPSSQSSPPIYDIRSITWNWVPFYHPCTAEEAQARGLSNVMYYGSVGGLGTTCIAIGYSSQVQVASLQTDGDKGSAYTITLNVDGQSPATLSLNTLSGSGQGALGNIAYAVWNGNFDSGKACPFSSTNYKAVYLNGNWNIVDAQAYATYVSNLNTIETLDAKCNFGYTAQTCIDNWITGIHNYIAQAERPVPIANSRITDASLNSAKLVITTQTPIQFPVTSLYIKASTLGVYTPVPVFSIVSSDSACFSTGSDGNIHVKIKNTGETGTFTAFATCTSPFAQSQNVQGSLNNGETKDIYIPISASASQKETSTCKVSVQSVATTITANTNVCVDPLVTCLVPYPKNFCDGNAVYQCSADQATKKKITDCTSDQYCDTASATCKTGSAGGTGIFDSIANFFKSLFGGLFDTLTTIKYFIIGIASLFVLFQSREFLLRFKDLRKNNLMRWLVSIGVAIGVGWLLYVFIGSLLFWGLLIGCAVFAYFMNITQINKFLPRR